METIIDSPHVKLLLDPVDHRYIIEVNGNELLIETDEAKLFFEQIYSEETTKAIEHELHKIEIQEYRDMVSDMDAAEEVSI
jgi:6-pyruvoyl-tetrahydropterin synthase